MVLRTENPFQNICASLPLAQGYCIDTRRISTEHLRALTAWLRAQYDTAEQVIYRSESFGIDDAREIRRRAHLSSVAKKFFIIATARITPEAQNALLKIIEEPPQETHFFIFTPFAGALLPTLRSRLQLIQCAPQPLSEKRKEEITKFLMQHPAERLRAVAQRASDKTWVAVLLSDTEQFFVDARRKKEFEIPDDVWTDAVALIGRMNQQIAKPASAARLIAEYISVTLPILNGGERLKN